MLITNNSGNGVFGDNLTNFTLANSSVTNNNADAIGSTEAGLRFNNLLGTSTITNSTVSGTRSDNVRLAPTSGTLTNLTISGTTVGPNPSPTGLNGFHLISTGTANVTITVNGSSLFTGNQLSGFLTEVNSGTSATLHITSSTFQDNNINLNLQSLGTGTQLVGASSNTLLRAASNAVNIFGDGQINGTLNGNTIGNGTADSGSRDANGIAVSHRSNLGWRLAITNNTIRNTDIEGIIARSGDVAGNTGSLDLTITGNTIAAPDDNSGFPLGPYGLQVRSRRTTTLCANIANNASQGNANKGYLLQRSDTSQFRMQGFTVDGATTIAANGNTTGGGAPTTDTIGEPFQGSCPALLPPAASAPLGIAAVPALSLIQTSAVTTIPATGLVAHPVGATRAAEQTNALTGAAHVAAPLWRAPSRSASAPSRQARA